MTTSIARDEAFTMLLAYGVFNLFSDLCPINYCQVGIFKTAAQYSFKQYSL